MTKKKKVLLIILGSIIILGLGAVIFGTMGMGEIREFKIANINLSNVKDGQYTGSCIIGRWSKTIRITVKGHKIIKTVFFYDPIVVLVTRATYHCPDIKRNELKLAYVKSSCRNTDDLCIVLLSLAHPAGGPILQNQNF